MPMTGNVRQTPQERVCGPIWAGHEQDTTSDGTGPQNGPEGTGDMESLQAMRAYVENHDRMDEFTRSTLRIYAKEIEREVEDNERFRREAEPFHDRLCRASERREDVTLWGVDYMPYPLDAEGEPFHVGDWVTGEWDAKAKVEAVTSDDVYWWEPDGCHWCHASEVRHYHAPTVEDVLREFIDALDIDRCDDPDATIAEFAKRLRLAGDE